MLFEFFVFGTFWFWVLIAAEFFFLAWVLEQSDLALGKAFISTILVLSLLFVGSGNSFKEAIHWAYVNPMYIFLGVFGYFLIGSMYVIAPYVGKWWCFVRNVREANRSEKAKWFTKWSNMVTSLSQEIEHLESRIKDSEFEAANNPPRRAGQASNSNYHGDREIRLAELNADKEKKIAARDAWANSKGVMTNELLPYWKEYEKDATFTNVFGRSVNIAKPTPDQYKSRIVSWIAYWPPSLFWTLLNDPIRHIGRMIYEGVAGWLKNISDEVWKNEDKI